MVGLIEIKATQPSWGLGLAELGNREGKFIQALRGMYTCLPDLII